MPSSARVPCCGSVACPGERRGGHRSPRPPGEAHRLRPQPMALPGRSSACPKAPQPPPRPFPTHGHPGAGPAGPRLLSAPSGASGGRQHPGPSAPRPGLLPSPPGPAHPAQLGGSGGGSLGPAGAAPGNEWNAPAAGREARGRRGGGAHGPLGSGPGPWWGSPVNPVAPLAPGKPMALGPRQPPLIRPHQLPPREATHPPARAVGALVQEEGSPVPAGGWHTLSAQ